MGISCSSVSMFKMRIGYSEDIHQLVENHPLIVGGIILPSSKGEKAHSDGDVLYHAIAESLLGALALGDLGTHFPDNDDRYLNMDSSFFVLQAYQMISLKGYKVINIDCTVFLEDIKLKPYISKIRENVSKLLNIEIENVSIKASTNEKLDSVGKGEAIRATSIVLLEEMI